MISKRSYLVQALYDWMHDNQLTPHVLVDAMLSGVRVPQQFVQQGQIVLNIAMSAVEGLVINRDELRFNASFQGKREHVVVPMQALRAIYAKESGDGMGFDGIDDGDDDGGASIPEKQTAGGHLRIVK